MKELVAAQIAERIKDGETVGVGTGSTVDMALVKIKERIDAEGLSVRVVPSSIQTAIQCEQIGLDVLSPLHCSELAWGFDGADEVDPDLRLIKGGGGAMLQEKILAAKCKKFIVIVDQGKLVSRLGEKFAVPLEVIPEAKSLVERELERLSALDIQVRKAKSKHGPVITEAGNLIVDARFDKIADDMEDRLNMLVGFVDNGIFTHLASEVLVGTSDGVDVLTR